MNLPTQSIRVPLSNGAIAELPAFVQGAFAVHRTIPAMTYHKTLTHPKTWTVTHLPTGTTAGDDFTTRQAALFFMQEIEPLTDWHKFHGQHVPHLAQQVRDIKARYRPAKPARNFTNEPTPIIVRVYNPTYSQRFADCGDVLVIFPTEVADYNGAAVNTLDIWLNRTTFVSHSNGNGSLCVMMDRKMSRPAPPEIVEQAVKWLTDHYATEIAPHGFRAYKRDQPAFQDERRRQVKANRSA